MIRTRLFSMAFLAVALGATVAQTAPDVAPAPREVVDVSEFKTVSKALKANPKEFNTSGSTVTGIPGFLGVIVGEKDGKAVIESVAPESPAEVAGVKEGDHLLRIGKIPVSNAAIAREILRNVLAGEAVLLTVERKGVETDRSVLPKPVSKPLTLNQTQGRPVLGVTLAPGTPKGGGVKIDDVTSGGAAAKAGVKAGDVIMKIDGKLVDGDSGFRDFLSNKNGGDVLELIVMRGETKLELKATVTTEERGGGRGGMGGWDDRIPRTWRKPTYRLAILGVEYPDVKHNPKIKDSDWEESMFSLGTYSDKSATGEKVYGSMNDYYKELSYGSFKVEGKFVGWVEASKKRLDYSSGSGTSTKEKTSLLTESLDLLTKKNGKDALKDYDGIFFLYAGGRVETTRGGLYWPHRANVNYSGRSLPYFIVQEGGARMTDISVFCHEFGHMLGLPDLYARPEQPGSEGVWQWCAMSNQIGGGRPQHFCAWSKEQLGWIKPTVIDPRVKQKLILSPIEDDPTQCFKVMLRPDASEYYLLEARKRTGWDSQLPGEGLLVWRVFNGARGQQQPVYLEESHGIEGARGPSSFPTSVPFPSVANNSFTPYTTPSSKSQLGGGLPVWITNIRKLPDGRVTFHIGYEYQ
jgi:M6 family metalloprotease-like protein